MQKNKLWLIIALVVIAPLHSYIGLRQKHHRNDPSDQSIQQTKYAFSSGRTGYRTSHKRFFTAQSKSEQDTEVNCQISMDGSNRLIVNEQTRNCFDISSPNMVRSRLIKLKRILKHALHKVIK